MNEAPNSTPISLIVIEDSIDDYDLSLARLRAAGRRVNSIRIESGRELREALAGGTWDAVLADHRLPRFSSLEALDIVRAHDRELPFIIVSGAIGEETAVEAMRSGADDYVMKSNLARLDPALARALDRAATRRRQRAAEEALVESELRFRALTGNLPGMVFQAEVRADRISLVYVSEGSRRMFGVAPDAMVADLQRLFGELERDDAEALLTLLRQGLSGIHDLHWRGRIRHDEGVAVEWIEVAASAREIAPGRVLWDGIVADISPQKRAEGDLRRSREELRRLALHLVRVREQERESIAREIHDDVGSTLTAAKFELSWLKGQLKDHPQVLAALARMDQLTDSAILSSTRIMHDLRPGILDEGVVPALEWQARNFEQRMGIQCGFASSHEEIPLSPDQAIAVFRICQEALNNVAKHAAATRVDITLRAGDGRLRLQIRDNGRGLANGDLGKQDRFGLRGMRERAQSLGGDVSIQGRAGVGTLITLSLPLAIPEDDPVTLSRAAS